MLKRIKSITILFIMVFPLPLHAALFQVGPQRTYQTLQEVAVLLNPGDVVEVDGDHTYPGDIVFNRAGSALEKIHIRGIRVNGNRPVISGGSNGVAFTTPWPYTGPEGGHHYVFEGFEVTNAQIRGIFHQAQDLTIRDCLVHDCPAHGILGADQGSGSLLLEYTEVTRCGSGDNRHQIYMATDEVNNPGSIFRMQNCFIHNAGGGNNVKSRAERNEIYYNWIEGAFYHELELIGPDSDADGGNPFLKREDSDVVGNVLIKRATIANNNPDFSVIRIGGDGTGESNGRYRFVNNTIMSGTGAVFRIFDTLESVEIHNNILFNPAGIVRFKRTVEANWVSGQETISGGNNWVKAGVEELPVQLINTVMGNDPGFTAANQNNLYPDADSPLINAGTLTTESAAGFEFPDPLPVPLKLPPQGAIESVGAALSRVITGNIDIGAFEKNNAGNVLYVDDGNRSGIQNGTIQYPYEDIQTAVENAVSGDIIKTATGSYGPVETLGKSLTFSGGFTGAVTATYTSGQGGDFSSQAHGPDATVISGGFQNNGVTFTRFDDNAYHGVLDNFTVSSSRKGIVWDTQISWPPPDNITISNSIVENNGQAGDTSTGSGILLCGENNRIISNVIRNNHGGRGAGLSRSGTPVNLLVTGNRIENNICYDDHGGGVYLDGSVTLTNNLISGNRIELGYGWGGGILILGTAQMSLNTISNNYAPTYGGGVFIDEGATAYMNNDLVYHNITEQGIGAGVAVDDGYEGASRLFMTNCTVVFNNPDFPADEYSRGGNGIFLDSNSSATVTNSVFWGNVDDFYVRDGSALALTYSLNQEGWAGTGNFSADPLFADPATGNFYLKSVTGRYNPATATFISDNSHSPGIDAGDPVSSFSNEPQPNGSRINVGCYGNTAQASRSQQAGSVIILTGTSPNHTIAAGTDARVYGTASSNQIILASGSKAELLNFPGQNFIQIQASSNLFSVSRSGTFVTFEGSDGTVLKIPATASVQTIAFTDQTLTLNIHNNQVMLDDQVITLIHASIEGG